VAGVGGEAEGEKQQAGERADSAELEAAASRLRPLGFILGAGGPRG